MLKDKGESIDQWMIKKYGDFGFITQYKLDSMKIIDVLNPYRPENED